MPIESQEQEKDIDKAKLSVERNEAAIRLEQGKLEAKSKDWEKSKKEFEGVLDKIVKEFPLKGDKSKIKDDIKKEVENYAEKNKEYNLTEIQQKIGNVLQKHHAQVLTTKRIKHEIGYGINKIRGKSGPELLYKGEDTKSALEKLGSTQLLNLTSAAYFENAKSAKFAKDASVQNKQALNETQAVSSILDEIKHYSEKTGEQRTAHLKAIKKGFNRVENPTKEFKDAQKQTYEYLVRNEIDLDDLNSENLSHKYKKAISTIDDFGLDPNELKKEHAEELRLRDEEIKKINSEILNLEKQLQSSKDTEKSEAEESLQPEDIEAKLSNLNTKLDEIKKNFSSKAKPKNAIDALMNHSDQLSEGVKKRGDRSKELESLSKKKLDEITSKTKEELKAKIQELTDRNPGLKEAVAELDQPLQLSGIISELTDSKVLGLMLKLLIMLQKMDKEEQIRCNDKEIRETEKQIRELEKAQEGLKAQAQSLSDIMKEGISADAINKKIGDVTPEAANDTSSPNTAVKLT